MICTTILNVPDTFQFYIPFILAILSFISTILILFTFIRFPRLRLNSGKMVLFIIICEFNMSWLIILSLNYQTSLSDQQECYDTGTSILMQNYQCDILGLFFLFFQWGYITMNGFLIHNLYYVLNYSGESDNFPQRFKYYLAITIVFSILLLIYASTDIQNQINIGFMGVCGVAKDSSIQFVAIVFLLLIFPFCIYVFVNSVVHYRTLLKTMSNQSKDEKSSMDNSKNTFEHECQRVYLFLNMSYMLLFVIDWLPLSILNFMSWSCTFYISCDYHSGFSEILETICLLLISGNGLFIFLIRIREPTLRKFFGKILLRSNSKTKQKHCLKTRLLDKALIQNQLNEPILIEKERETLEVNPEHNISLEPEKLIPEDKNLIYLRIFFLLRVMLMKQMGGGDIKFYSSCESPFGDTAKHSRSDDVSVSQSVFSHNSEDKIPWANHFYTKFDVEMYDINKLLVELPEESERNLIQDKENNENIIVTSISYCRKLFDWLRGNKFKTDLKSMIDSLDIVKNQENISKNTTEKLSHHEFTTFDYKLVIMVISKEVKKFLLDGFLRDYHEHINNKNLSFLPKYLGLFSFQFQQKMSNKSYSILICENPFAEYNFYKVKPLFLKPPKEILAIYYVQAEKTKKKTLYKFEDKQFMIEKSDLKIKSDDKSMLLSCLYEDLTFLTNKSAFNYRLCLAFFKYDDQVLIDSKFNGFFSEDTVRSKKYFVNSRFALENGIGFCIGSLRNIFKFMEKRKKKRKEKLKFDVAINKEVSIYNPKNYGRFLYDQAQDL